MSKEEIKNSKPLAMKSDSKSEDAAAPGKIKVKAVRSMITSAGTHLVIGKHAEMSVEEFNQLKAHKYAPIVEEAV